MVCSQAGRKFKRFGSVRVFLSKRISGLLAKLGQIVSLIYGPKSPLMSAREMCRTTTGVKNLSSVLQLRK